MMTYLMTQPMAAQLTPNGREVLERRYLRRSEDGRPIETIEEMFLRVGRHIANANSDPGPDGDLQRAQWTIRYTDMMSELLFLPNTPTFNGAGTPLGQLAACFVLPIDDDLGKESHNGIFSTLHNAALIQQSGGGVGFSFSRLRPKGDRVSKSGGIASGPVSFMRVYDVAFNAIAQGGTRRGASMGVLRFDHPDILEFMACKEGEGSLTNFNLSVGITDAFMRAYLTGQMVSLINPRTGQTTARISSIELMHVLATRAHANGEPGVLFLDTINRNNPVPNLYTIETTNPCVSADTMVLTTNGPARVSDLIGQPFDVLVDGKRAHCPNGFFKTGTDAQLFRLQTKEGYFLRATENHCILTEYGDYRALKDIKTGDRVVLSNNCDITWGTGGAMDFGKGWLLGLLVSDGYFHNEHGAVLEAWGAGGPELIKQAALYIQTLGGPARYNTSRIGHYSERLDKSTICSRKLLEVALEYGIDQNKHISTKILATSRDFQIGFCRGMFDGDGSVQGNHLKGSSVRLSSSTIGHLQIVQNMLSNLGIISTIYNTRRPAGIRLLPDGHGKLAPYYCKEQHELSISRANMVLYATRVGFFLPTKMAKLEQLKSNYKRMPNKETFLATITSVIPDGREDVYDCTVPDLHAFVANGIIVHNCGEQALGPFENCCLGSINLAKHLTDAGNDLDWHKLAKTIYTAVRFLDDVITVNNYIPTVPELREAAWRVRRIGLGFMGLGDVLFAVGARYGGPDGIAWASAITEFFTYTAMEASVELARERGPFPAILGSIFDPVEFRWKPPTCLEYVDMSIAGPPTPIDWAGLCDRIRRYGIRNGAVTTVAPTGTVGTVAGVEAYGLEPVFALSYTRYMTVDGARVPLEYINKSIGAALKKHGIDEDSPVVKGILSSGSCQNVPGVPDEIKRVFVTATDITPTEHVLMQAAVQRYLSNSASKTINMPNTATVADVCDAITLAWSLKCMGLTVYRSGSRDVVVLKSGNSS